jgi:hypothetical protein
VKAIKYAMLTEEDVYCCQPTVHRYRNDKLQEQNGDEDADMNTTQHTEAL